MRQPFGGPHDRPSSSTRGEQRPEMKKFLEEQKISKRLGEIGEEMQTLREEEKALRQRLSEIQSNED